MADGTTPDTVSREAHQRVVTERDQFKAQVDTLARQVSEAGTLSAALGAFATLRPDAGVADIIKATKVALPHLTGLEGEALTEKVKSEFDFLLPVAATPSQAAPPLDPDADPTVPTVDTAPPPGWAQPSPTGDGDSPAHVAQKMTVDHPDVRAVIEREGTAGLQRLDKAGVIEWRTDALPMGFGPG